MTDRICYGIEPVKTARMIAASLAFAIVALGCQGGQDGPTVSIHNATDVEMFVLRPTWSHSSPEIEGWHLPAGETLQDQWHAADRATIQPPHCSKRPER